MAQLLGRGEVLKILVIAQNVNGKPGSLQFGSPLLKAADDGEQLLVVDLVVALSWVHALGEVRDRMYNSLSVCLRQHTSSDVVGCISLDDDW